MDEWQELNGIVEFGEAVAAGMVIEARYLGSWCPWKGASWGVNVPYRARPRKPAKVMVKSLCYRRHTCGSLMWRNEDYPVADGWTRFPAGDLPGEVEA